LRRQVAPCFPLSATRWSDQHARAFGCSHPSRVVGCVTVDECLTPEKLPNNSRCRGIPRGHRSHAVILTAFIASHTGSVGELHTLDRSTAMHPEISSLAQGGRAQRK
jgi:hypothetical protein